MTHEDIENMRTLLARRRSQQGDGSPFVAALEQQIAAGEKSLADHAAARIARRKEVDAIRAKNPMSALEI